MHVVPAQTTLPVADLTAVTENGPARTEPGTVPPASSL
jgi:hypothetical protein